MVTFTAGYGECGWRIQPYPADADRQTLRSALQWEVRGQLKAAASVHPDLEKKSIITFINADHHRLNLPMAVRVRNKRNQDVDIYGNLLLLKKKEDGYCGLSKDEACEIVATMYPEAVKIELKGCNEIREGLPADKKIIEIQEEKLNDCKGNV